MLQLKKILNHIEIANKNQWYGQTKAGGYIWHATDSGKTLTSFKAATLACKLPYIDKVLFVVDRKDLDYQTMCEYDKFKPGAANSSTSTKILKEQLENEQDEKIIITTIQELNNFIRQNQNQYIYIYNKQIVFIFDECHRSQFGDMHSSIIRNFKKILFIWFYRHSYF